MTVVSILSAFSANSAVNAKQSQFSDSPSGHKSLISNGIRKCGPVLGAKKTKPNKPNFRHWDRMLALRLSKGEMGCGRLEEGRCAGKRRPDRTCGGDSDYRRVPRSVRCRSGVHPPVSGGNVSGVRDESEQHGNLALNVDFSIDVSGVSLYGAGLDVQNFGNVAIPETLANEFRNLALTRRQIVPALHIGPLPLVEQHGVGLSTAGITISRVSSM